VLIHAYYSFIIYLITRLPISAHRLHTFITCVTISSLTSLPASSPQHVISIPNLVHADKTNTQADILQHILGLATELENML